MQINSSNLAEVKSHFPAITWRELAYDACASFWVGTWWLHRKIIDRKGNVFEGIADYNSKTPRVRANYIFKFIKDRFLTHEHVDLQLVKKVNARK